MAVAFVVFAIAFGIWKLAVGTAEFQDVRLNADGTVTFTYHPSASCSHVTFHYDFRDASGATLGTLDGDSTRSVSNGESVDVTATGKPPVGATSVNVSATC